LPTRLHPAENGTVSALEVNTTPGMSYDSNYITAARLLGFGHTDMVIATLREAAPPLTELARPASATAPSPGRTGCTPGSPAWPLPR
jgi:hypothetical protein